MTAQLRILIVDDHPDDPSIPQDPPFETRFPSELNLTDIERCQLVLVDFNLSAWNGPEGSGALVSFARDVRDGLALAGVIASAMRERDRDRKIAVGERSPTALAVVTAELDKLAPVGVAPLPHIAARAVGVDWVFLKSEGDWSDKAVALARAVARIPQHWDETTAEAQLRGLLGLLADDKSGWPLLAWESVLDANPPIHEISRWTEGLAVLRWLSHRVLPHPTFIWSSHQIAKRLQVKLSWLAGALDDGPLAKLLAPARYDGVLTGLFQSRWWGAGVEQILRQTLESAPGQRRSIVEWLCEDHQLPPDAVFESTHVLCLDEHLDFEPELAPMDSCVRLRVDGWPIYAHEAWVRIDTVNDHPHLKGRVLLSDQDHLEADDGDP